MVKIDSDGAQRGGFFSQRLRVFVPGQTDVQVIRDVRAKGSAAAYRIEKISAAILKPNEVSFAITCSCSAWQRFYFDEILP